MLSITIEDSWRGPILDTVRAIADLDLIEDKSLPGVKNLGSEYPLTLQSDEVVLVWCALTAQKKVVFSLRRKETELLSLTTESPFYAEVRMPDEKLYQFEFKDES